MTPEEDAVVTNLLLLIFEQCTEGLRCAHDCPATYALGTILAELTYENDCGPVVLKENSDGL